MENISTHFMKTGFFHSQHICLYADAILTKVIKVVETDRQMWPKDVTPRPVVTGIFLSQYIPSYHFIFEVYSNASHRDSPWPAFT